MVISSIRKRKSISLIACINKLAGVVSHALEVEQKFASPVVYIYFLLFE